MLAMFNPSQTLSACLFISLSSLSVLRETCHAQMDDVSVKMQQLYLRFQDVTFRNGSDNHQASPIVHPWIPPRRRSDFEVPRTTNWMVWNGNNLSTPPEHMLLPNHISCHSTTSLFWSSESGGIIQVPYDCTAIDVITEEAREPRLGWNDITFGQPDDHLNNQYPHLWLVGRNLHEGQIKANMTDAWEDLLAYRYFVSGHTDANRPPTCELAGSLSILFGLVALTMPWERLPNGLAQALVPSSAMSYIYNPTWNRGLDRSGGRHRHRGLVVQVGFDSNHYYQSQQTIENYEKGHYGAILRPDLRSNNNYRQT